jgi:hypothetical protein
VEISVWQAGFSFKRFACGEVPEDIIFDKSDASRNLRGEKVALGAQKLGLIFAPIF